MASTDRPLAGTGARPPHQGVLAPYRVLDLTDRSGWLCGRILGDLGADVVKIEPPRGDPGRQLGPFFRDDPDPEQNLAWFAYNANKRGITLALETGRGQDLLRGLAQRADFLVESFPPGHLDARGLGYRALHETNPRLVFTSITPFGQSGPYARYRGSDLIAMAMSGLMALVGAPGRPPLRVSLPQAAMWTGMHAAAGTLIAHHYRQATGRGQHVDVAMRDSLLWALANAPAYWSLLRQDLQRGGSSIVGRSTTGARMRAIYRCQDGHINFIFYGGEAGRRSNEAMVQWMAERHEAPDWLARMDWGTFNVATCTQEEIDRLEEPFVAFLANRTKAEFTRESVKRSILGYPVASARDIRDDPQLAARGFWQRVDHPELDATVTYPGPFAKFSAARCGISRRAPRIGEHNAEIYGAELGLPRQDRDALERERVLMASSSREGRRPADAPAGGVGGGTSQERAEMPGQPQALAGVKVVEFAVFAAGPMIGKHMGEHGATVIRVESRSRPDGFRVHYPPYKDNIPGLNRTGSFALFNNNKLGITLNLKHPDGVALGRRLAAWADVLIDNFVPGVMERNGLGYAAVQEINPSIIYLSSCNMGQTGPKSSQRGFGSQLTSQSGFTYLTGEPHGEPMLLFGPYIDFVAVGFGLIAVMAALDDRRRTGSGQHIDLSQYETGLQFVAPALLEYEVAGRVQTRQGNRSPHAAPHGAYPCRGEDRWCVIAVCAEEEWRALCRAAGHPEWMDDPRFATLSARKAHEDDLDALIAGWTRQFGRHEVMERLQAVGVSAGVVSTVSDLFADPQLAHRRVWQELPHPELEKFHYEAPPFILSETPTELRRSPLLGEHNDRVYGEILGLARAEIERLITAGVIE
ncbi:MAG TPA: CoA transferase [bacterium]|nr:CoA transferase [bacterium]